MRHPGKYELLAYAESLTDDCSSISVRIAGHVARCPRCQAEVEGARTSLSVLRLSPDVDPSDDSTLRLLKAAREERRRFQQQQAARSTAWTVLKGLGYAAGILVVSALCFGVALGSSGQGIAPAAARISVHNTGVMARQDVEQDQPSPEALRKTTAEIQALVAAVNAPSKNPPSALELERRRAVSALNKDLEAARSALARNPGCERALRVMDSNLQRQAQALRTLYAERSL